MDEQTVVTGRAIHITGVVQGVGFRPFVYGLAKRHELSGWVRNTSAGVDIVVNGRPAALHTFLRTLQRDLPPLARIDTFEVNECPVDGFTGFDIVPSTAVSGAFQLISPDVGICPDCLRELFDPTDRRYRYPFINCTHCGPRFTIIQDIPYDRPNTTMAPFALCPDCQAEYDNPLNRRFHAQPVACPVCGPQVWLQVAGCRLQVEHPIEITRQLLTDGKIVAVKGLGGFHLVCDALNETAVTTLRQRKLRVDKPFALMMPDVATVEQHCFVNDAERELLNGRERPIVLLKRKLDSPLSTQIAPGQNTMGVMLPYTPLHYLLLEPSPDPHKSANLRSPVLVMTSGNLSEEPIAYTNDEALERLSDLADAFLLHNRDIHVRCDDSVTRIVDLTAKGAEDAKQIKKSLRSSRPLRFEYPLRRSRGYAPDPIPLPQPLPPILATGAELKNTFCLTRDRYAFMSHHIGDLESYETLRSFEEGIIHFERLFRMKPELIAYDKHPNYLSTRYALERAEREGLTAVGVQHHHAHIAACMAEHGLSGDRPVIGVVLDGTGFGDDGTIWGGEFMVADYAGFTRPYHLLPISLPGGDTAVRQPWRVALSWLHQAGIDWGEELSPVRWASSSEQLGANSKQSAVEVVRRQLQTGVNAPRTSSMGRLFDAVAALIGVRQVVNYEAQAAVELEALVDEMEMTHASSAIYPFAITNDLLDPTPLLHEMVYDLRQGVATAVIAARFHQSVAGMVTAVCQHIRQQTGLTDVILSGGVWQNMTLLQQAIPQLDAAGFTVYWHQKVPANDGGLALGQAVIAARRYKTGNLEIHSLHR